MENKVNEAPEAPDTRERDRAILAAMAAEEVATVGGEVNAEESQPAAPRMDAVESLAGLLSMVGVVAKIAKARNIAAVWNRDDCATLAGAVVPVLRKYPWGAPVLEFLETGTGSEEVTLAVALVPMAISTWAAYKADSAAAMAQPEKPEEGAAKAAGDGGT